MTEAARLVRDVARLYVRSQRDHAECGDGGSTVKCHVLTELVRQEGLTQRALAQRLGLDKGWISRAVDSLVADGAVFKQASTQDRRSVTLTLTPVGRIRAGALEAELDGHAAQLLARIPGDRHAQVQESLQLLLDALSGDGKVRQRAMCGPLNLRRAASTDWPGIAQLLMAAGLPQDGARDHIDQFIVGEIDGELACAGGLEIYGADALLRSVVVADEMRGRSCARRMLDQLMQDCTGLGVTRMYLLTTTAQAYFSRLGFAVVDRGGIPEAVRLSREFQGACPASATAMALQLNCSASV